MANPIVCGTYASVLSATVTLPTTAANSDSAAIDITVEGAKIGQPVDLSLRSDLVAGVTFKQPAYVSAPDTVTFKFHNHTGAEVYSTPGSATADIVLL